MQKDDSTDRGSDFGEVEYEPEAFVVGPYTFEVTTVAFLPIETLMANASKDVEISGQKLWCGSLAVTEYLLDHTDFVRDHEVVELGAGTGVLGMLSKRLGASRILLTDNDRRSLSHMVIDCERNHVEAEVHSFDWFEPHIEGLSVGSSGNIRVLAGDVLYKRCLLDPFMRTVSLLLAMGSCERSASSKKSEVSSPPPNESTCIASSKSTDRESSQMLLCHVPRAGVRHEDVAEAASKAGLQLEELSPSEWRKGACVEYCPEEDTAKAKLYLVTLAIVESRVEALQSVEGGVDV